MSAPATRPAPLTLSRPRAGEAAPWYHGYIAAVPDERVGHHLAEQPRELEQLAGALGERAALARYAPGKWSVKEVVGHVTDAERVFAYRLLRIARGDRTPLAGFDENAYVAAAGFDARPIAELVADFVGVRLATLSLVRALAPAAWDRVGEANSATVSARALAYIVVGHAAHHLAVLRDRYGLGPPR